jgi:hypothetical protein
MSLCKRIRDRNDPNELIEIFRNIETIYSDLKPWVNWWIRDENSKLLCRSFSSNNHWSTTPNDTNIIESLNNVLDKVASSNICVQFISEFHLDPQLADDLIAASTCIRLSYRDRCKEVRDKQNKNRKNTRYRQRSINDLLDSRASDSRRMGISKGRENTAAFNQSVMEANSKFNNTILESIEHAIQSSGDTNGEKSLENNSDDEYHLPIRKQKKTSRIRAFQ